jgi:hypothetical protein
MHGPRPASYEQISNHFQGRVLLVNGEPFGIPKNQLPSKSTTTITTTGSTMNKTKCVQIGICDPTSHRPFPVCPKSKMAMMMIILMIRYIMPLWRCWGICNLSSGNGYWIPPSVPRISIILTIIIIIIMARAAAAVAFTCPTIVAPIGKPPPRLFIIASFPLTPWESVRYKRNQSSRHQSSTLLLVLLLLLLLFRLPGLIILRIGKFIETTSTFWCSKIPTRRRTSRRRF